MTVGAFGDIVFETSDKKILTMRNLSVTVGSSWAVHNNIGGKQKTEYTGPQLRKASFEMTLSSGLGVNPRKMMQRLEQMAESSEAHMLIIGSKPVGENPWRLVSLSEEWETVMNRGELISATTTVNLEEYV